MTEPTKKPPISRLSKPPSPAPTTVANSDTTKQQETLDAQAAGIIRSAASYGVVVPDNEISAVTAMVKQALRSGESTSTILGALVNSEADGGTSTPTGSSGDLEWTTKIINGRTVLFPPAGLGQPIVLPNDSAGRTANQEAADAAQAGYYGALTRKTDAEIAAEADIRARVAAGELKPTSVPNVFMTPSGQIVDYNSSLEQMRSNKAREAGDAESRLLARDEFTSNDRFRTGQLANDQTRIGIERQRLGADIGRLALETSAQQARNASEQQQNEMRRQQFEAEILRNPSDFLARGQVQRGGAPAQRITQADLLNQLRGEFNRLAPGQQLQPAQTPQFAEGGMTNERRMIVGDPQADGGPNPEVIHNPTGAPLSITPMRDMQRMPAYAEGTNPKQETQDPMQAEMQAKVKSMSRLLQFVENPDTMHALVDELTQARGRLGQTAQTDNTPRFAYGTDKTGQPDPITLNPTTGQWEQGGQQVGGFADAGQRIANQSNATHYSDGDAYSPKNDAATPLPAPLNKPVAPKLLPGKPDSEVDYTSLFRTLLDASRPAPLQAPPPVSQAQLEADAAGKVRQLGLDRLFGDQFDKVLPTQETTPNPRQAGNRLNPLRFQFPLFNPQQLGDLTNDETTALDKYLGLKYNTTLSDVVTAQRQVFGRPEGRTGRLLR